ncbi:hypothetical protein COCSUDRAFT_60406 [Coccomyxa subellipsoidea C-169]|uniref:IFT52 GIFT domain-containing protein n=1 Tax=Coccomyxa subellipsoidea (strain C-169) TaxID=574566 RepID=I0YII6_COCSC|nr:hypothetical protein COCSUDRAFT_60406 [Coccomyxa subellipsoidea C-169]EIE18205.1 hypothetical protein COCSUDRAFT_60406 [Coccomyxa subellipsoidea C-169]|eukprot:XP_005642749.1 hypothetical protein COCSUDRAFT_60406 [Coccomyxa subellipsoidea C-169]
MSTNRDGRYDTGRPDTAISTNSEFAESQQQSRPRALLCCGFGHISKPKKSGYKQLIKRLKSHFRLTVLEEAEQSLGACPMEGYSLLVIACPRHLFTQADLACAHHFVGTGGWLLVTAEAGGDALSGSNLDELLVPFSIAVEYITVLRAVPGDACMHPTTACIGADGVVSKSLLAALERRPTTQQADSYMRPSTALSKRLDYRPSTAASLTPWPPGSPAVRPGTALRAGAAAKAGAGPHSNSNPGSADAAKPGVQLAYVRGAPLGVEAPAVPVLATGQTCSPTQLPIGAVWSGEEGQGRVAVLGSSASFDDTNIGTHCNAALLDWLLAWLQHGADAETRLNSTAALAAMTNLGDMSLSPDTFALSERLRPCFPQEPELAHDWTLLLDRTIYWPAVDTR